MSKIIIFSEDNGNMGICIPNPKLDINFVLNKDCPNGIIVDTSIVENLDKDFFDAYEIKNNLPSINITKAKEAWKNKIRNARVEALAKLDIDFIKAQEQSLDTTQIVADKQTLRDLPNQVDIATTINEIKAVWNNMLGDK